MTSSWHAYVDLITEPGGWWLALLPIVMLFCLWCLAVQVGLTRLLRARPSQERITDAEIRSIPLLYPSRSFSDDARKGYRADFQHVVVDLAERRRRMR